VLISHLEHQA